jgi:hypothetical protein
MKSQIEPVFIETPTRVDQSISFEVDHHHSVVDDDDGDVISNDQPSLRSENNVVDHDHSGLDNDEQNKSESEIDIFESGINVFDMVVKRFLSICFVPTSPPPQDAKPFETDKDFREYFDKYPLLMRSQLASYISTKPSFSSLREAEEFRKALPSYPVNL